MTSSDTATPEPAASTLEYAITRIGDHFIDVIYFDLGRYLMAAGALTLFLLVFRS